MDIQRFEDAEFTKAYGILCASVPALRDREGLVPTFCRIPVGGRTTRHAHFEPELFFIIRGTGRLEIADESGSVGSGDLVRIPPFSPHEMINEGADDLAFLSVSSEDFESPHLPGAVVVTAAPPTPNGPLHLGHISGPYLASDVVSRYLRLRSRPVRSHVGTDDHQNYVSERARSLGRDPEAFRREMRSRIDRGLQVLRIRFDEFVEPKTDLKYQAGILEFARRALEAGVIKRETVALPYCDHCEHPLVDALIDGDCPVCEESSRGGCESCGVVVPPWTLLNAKCSRCGRIAGSKDCSVLTFDLSAHLPSIQTDLNRLALPPRLRRLIERVNGAKDVQVLIAHPDVGGSGLRLPGTDQNLHVWFEMAAHYDSFSRAPESWVHCFGFDNAFYYLLFIPALLRALNPDAKLPYAVSTNEFLLLDGLKFSTSRGHAIWADEFDGDPDHLRLYLSLHRPSTTQSQFSLGRFHEFSADLAERSRRLHERALALSRSSGDEGLPGALVECNRFTREMELFFSPEGFDLRRAAHRLHGFMDQTIHFAGDERGEKLMLRTLAHVMAPLMPAKSESLLNALGERHRGWVTDWTRTL